MKNKNRRTPKRLINFSIRGVHLTGRGYLLEQT